MHFSQEYTWQFRGRGYWLRWRWPRAWWDHVVQLPHDVLETKRYGYYVRHEPFPNGVDQLAEYVLDQVNGDQGLEEPRDALACLLAFVQYLDYVPERGEYPRYPSETLMNVGGDCEDTAILMAYFARALGYDVVFIHFKSTGFLGIGAWGHVDLGIAANHRGEFSGDSWTYNGRKFYYAHCNGRGMRIGEYGGDWGNSAYVYPV